MRGIWKGFAVQKDLITASEMHCQNPKDSVVESLTKQHMHSFSLILLLLDYYINPYFCSGEAYSGLFTVYVSDQDPEICTTFLISELRYDEIYSSQPDVMHSVSRFVIQ